MKPQSTKIALAFLTAVIAAFALLYAVPAHSYLPMGGVSGGVLTPDNWGSTPVPIEVSTNVTAAGSKLQGNTTFLTVIQNSLASWNQAPNFQTPLGSVSTSTTQVPDGSNLICFCSSGGIFTQGDGALAVTITSTTGTTITAASIFFNPNPTNVCFATDSNVSSCASPSDRVQDLQTVATHEIGHFIGLDHSAIVRATMFPFAPGRETELSWDDVAGATLLYPKSALDVQTGAISGTISLTGAVFGAHVSANSNDTTNPFGSFPNIRKSAIGTLTDPGGNYAIKGVPPGTYLVIAEPLDGPVTSSNVDWGTEFGQGLQTGFTTRFH